MPMLLVVLGFQVPALAVVAALGIFSVTSDSLWQLGMGCMGFDVLVIMADMALGFRVKKLRASSTLNRAGRIFCAFAAVAVFGALLIPEFSQVALVGLGATNLLLMLPFIAEAKTWRD